MENANSREYLEKILAQVLENMKKTAHAPSVQMTDIPRESLGMNDDDEAALEDLDDDENPDKRITQRKADKYVEKNGELSDSEDEDMDGMGRQSASRKRRVLENYRHIMDVGGNDSGLETASGMGTPQAGSSLPDDVDEMNVDELGSKVAQTPSPSSAPLPESTTEPGPQSPHPPPADDGDVEMGEADAANGDADANGGTPPAAANVQSTGEDTITVQPHAQQPFTPPESPAQPAQAEEPASTTTDTPATIPKDENMADDSNTITVAPAATTEPEATGATAAEVAIKKEVAGDDEVAQAQEQGRMEREAANAEGEARTNAATSIENDTEL